MNAKKIKERKELFVSAGLFALSLHPASVYIKFLLAHLPLVIHSQFQLIVRLY